MRELAALEALGLGQPTVEDHKAQVPVIAAQEQASSSPQPAETIHTNAETTLKATGSLKPENFRISDDDLGVGSVRQRLEWNLTALRTLDRIRREDRPATADEQSVLSHYVGWGALSQVFDESREDWAKAREELTGLLGQDGYNQARASTLNAHYTSPVVIKAMYQALEKMGFDGGDVLEPACGIGNFLGLMPECTRAGSIHAVEIDETSARIAAALYPTAKVTIKPFEQTAFADGSFDMAIGNVPFGDYSVLDKRYDQLHLRIHDYFIVKTLDLLRPGGVAALITSKGTLDKQSPAARREMAVRAELLGAIRLPNNAFAANAGTEVTTDILFFQRRDDAGSVEPEWLGLGQTADGIEVNAYFTNHPEMVMGQLVKGRGMYREDEVICEPIPAAVLANQLVEAVARIEGKILYAEQRIVEEKSDISKLEAPPGSPDHSFVVVDGTVYFHENGRLEERKFKGIAGDRVCGMVAIRDCAYRLLDMQIKDSADSELSALRLEFNEIYDSFTAKYGALSVKENAKVFAEDATYPFLRSVENVNDEGKFIGKAEIFFKRTVKPYEPPLKADTPVEALAISLTERGAVDLDYMATLCGTDEAEIIDGLAGEIYRVPGADAWQASDEYLSGDIRAKLAEARKAAVGDTSFAANVAALEEVMPPDIPVEEIQVRLGATWIPAQDVRDWLIEILDMNWRQRGMLQVTYDAVANRWYIPGCGQAFWNSTETREVFGTRRRNALELVQDALNLTNTRVTDQHPTEENRRVVNRNETLLAQSKQDDLRRSFADWVFVDPVRRKRLLQIYNERFNSVRERTFDGSRLALPGMNCEIKLAAHQKDAVARVVYGGNTLLAHVVGAGKTFAMTAAAQELRRLGLAMKSMFVVPNHLTEQWGSEYLRLYPLAKLLVATEKDFKREKRQEFCSRIATGDYDAVILGHSQFEMIPLSNARLKVELEREIEEVIDAIKVQSADGGKSPSVKDLEKRRKQLQVKLAKLADDRKDNVITFEQLGVDRLFIDESHYYKNLYTVTKLSRVAGVATTDAKKTTDLLMKIRYLEELNPNRSVVFATGTPISNSMVELYTLQRYLQPEQLKRSGLVNFDSWASSFGEIVTSWDLAPEGKGYQTKTKFARFCNLPELMQLFHQVADIRTADMLKLDTPEVHLETVVVKPSEIQKAIVDSLAERAAKVRSGSVDPTQDNMLCITNDGRKLALDQRLIDETLPETPGGKIDAVVNNVFRLWEQHAPTRSAQLVFCDLSTPKPDGGFTVYAEIKRKLVERGVPESEVAFIHEAKDKKAKATLFARVNAGAVRVLIGSTPMMGAGTNVQERLVAIHDADCPWRPSDLEQRRGRIERQGNKFHSDVWVFRYVTEGTFDSYLYQTLENKQRFITQVMTSKTPVRSAADLDETVLSYAEVKALAAGDSRIKEKMELEVTIDRLRILRQEHQAQLYRLQDKVNTEYPKWIRTLDELIPKMEIDAAVVVARAERHKEHFEMEIQGSGYSERVKAGEALLALRGSVASVKPVQVGGYRGFSLAMSYNPAQKVFQMEVLGQHSYRVDFSDSALGMVSRLDNAIDGIAKGLVDRRGRLEELRAEEASARELLVRPFEQEDEYQAKVAALAVINAELQIPESGDLVVEIEPDSIDAVDEVFARSAVLSIAERVTSATEEALASPVYAEPALARDGR
jgi:N12 class adenine-specific DNA methylase/SAM-dependent methyltransferase